LRKIGDENKVKLCIVSDGIRVDMITDNDIVHDVKVSQYMLQDHPCGQKIIPRMLYHKFCNMASVHSNFVWVIESFSLYEEVYSQDMVLLVKVFIS